MLLHIVYNKLFTKILDSSIWLEPSTTRVVWITLLATMDQDGYAHFSAVENLASRARVTKAEAEAAIECFLNPDPNSGNPANEGRRVERVPGGFMVLNASVHRGTLNRVIEREQTRERVARHRSQKKSKALANAEAEAGVTVGNGCNNVTALQEVDGKAKRRTDLMTKARIVLAHLNEGAGRHFRETELNLSLIAARLSETKEDVDGIRKMIERQIERWRGTDQAEYLRPETLFRKSKFDGYYDNRDLPIFNDNDQHAGRSKHGSGRDRTTHTEAPGERFITGRDELRKQHAAAAAADDIAMDGPIPL